MSIKFAIIKERKNPPDRRVVFSPSKLVEAKNAAKEAASLAAAAEAETAEEAPAEEVVEAPAETNETTETAE